MLPLAHLGIAILVGKPLQWWNPRLTGRIRWWLLGALLPDLIDKGLNVYGHGWEHTTRGIAHTAAFTILLITAGTWVPYLRPIGLGSATHILADVPWTYAQTFLWPAKGPEFTPGTPISLEAILRRLQQPENYVAEILGGLLLAAYMVSLVLEDLRRKRYPIPERGRVRRLRETGLPERRRDPLAHREHDREPSDEREQRHEPQADAERRHERDEPQDPG